MPPSPNKNGWLVCWNIRVRIHFYSMAKMNTVVLILVGINAFLALFWAYVGQPDDHIGWATLMPFTSIYSTNPRTNPWNSHEKILRIGGVEKLSFFELAILILKKISLVFWSKRWHQKDVLKLTDLYSFFTIRQFHCTHTMRKSRNMNSAK